MLILHVESRAEEVNAARFEFLEKIRREQVSPGLAQEEAQWQIEMQIDYSAGVQTGSSFVDCRCAHGSQLAPSEMRYTFLFAKW